MSITVGKINLSTFNSNSSIFYVGRKFKDINGSALGNPFKIGKDGSRQDVVAKYRQWLWQKVQKGMKGEDNQVWQELLNLLEYYKENGEMSLICWCYPQACHADVVKSCLEWLATQKY